MIKQYEQLVLTYEQLILEYEHFLWMAKQLPGLPRHALSYTPWRYSSSTDIYGTSGGWTQELEAATLSTADEMNTHIAVLNKINAAGMMAVRASQDTNQLLVAVLEHQIAESKRRRDEEAAEIANHIADRTQSRAVADAGTHGTTQVLHNFRMP